MTNITSDEEFIEALFYGDTFGNLTFNQRSTLARMFLEDSANIVEIRLLKEFYEEILNCEHIEGVADERLDYLKALYEDGGISKSGVEFCILRDQIKSGIFDFTSEDDPF